MTLICLLWLIKLPPDHLFTAGFLFCISFFLSQKFASFLSEACREKILVNIQNDWWTKISIGKVHSPDGIAWPMCGNPINTGNRTCDQWTLKGNHRVNAYIFHQMKANPLKWLFFRWSHLVVESQSHALPSVE